MMKRIYFKDLLKCPFCYRKPKYFPNKEYIGCMNPMCIIFNIATDQWELWNKRGAK